MPKVQEVKEQVKAAGGPSGFLAPKVIEDLAGVLSTNERLLRVVQGKFKGEIGLAVATERRLILISKKVGMLGSKVTSEDFGYDKITSAEIESRFGMGTLKIHASGNDAQLTDANAQQLQELAEVIRTQQSAGKAPAPAAASPSDGDVISKLERIGKLKEQGILTEEEFQAQKRQILGA